MVKQTKLQAQGNLYQLQLNFHWNKGRHSKIMGCNLQEVFLLRATLQYTHYLLGGKRIKLIIKKKT
jgi:hypothetical protein